MDEYGPNRMIRGRRFKYVARYPYGPNELYDLETDPGETKNLLKEGGFETWNRKCACVWKPGLQNM